jgi:hypothetical protein
MSILAGDFFVLPRLPVDIDGFDYSHISETLARIFPFFPSQPLPTDTLVIHIRSGDIFGERPHPSMGQPPLSFYVTVIEETKPSRVVLVYEDDRNPVIRVLSEYLNDHAIDHQIRSGDLAEDLGVLLAARQLVTGNGTFGQGILLLSQNLEKWFVFGQGGRRRFPRGSKLHVCSITDESGDYGKELNPWRNSAKQRELMVMFPASNLTVSWIVS